MNQSHRIKIKLSYDGTLYNGWQRQPEGVPTIQAAVEDSLKRIFNQDIPVVGASRTDAGVHAVGQVAHFDVPRDPTQFKDFCYTLQALLPPDIVVKEAWLAPPEFDASWEASSKIYRYVIYNAKRPTALQNSYTHWVRRELNMGLLHECASFIEGKHDFSSFRNTGSDVKTNERHIFSAKWIRKPGNILIFQIHGKGFLKQMVRNLVGTLLDLESENATLTDFKAILKAKDRKAALSTAPAKGLYLMRIFYPKNLDNKCRKL